MNSQVWTNGVNNATTAYQGNDNFRFGKIIADYSIDDFRLQSDRQSFMQLLSDTGCEGGVDQLETARIFWEECAAAPDQQENGDSKTDLLLDDNPIAREIAGIGMSPLQTVVRVRQECDLAGEAKDAIPVNVAAARIIEELQTRLRRSEAKRWQLCLPGLLGDSVLVTVEQLHDLSWLVEVSAPDVCSDENRMNLQHQLTERLGDISLSTTSR